MAKILGIKEIVSAALLAAGMLLFSQWYIDLNRNATPESSFLTYAIFTGSIALFLHLFKDFHLIKKKESTRLAIDCIELFLLFMTPLLSIFQIYSKEHTELTLIILISGAFVWWIIVLFRTNNKSGKEAFITSAQLYGGLIAVLALALWTNAFLSNL